MPLPPPARPVSRRAALAPLCILLAATACPAAEPAPRTPRDLTFFVVSDTHYGLSPEGDRTVPKLVDMMNQLPGTTFPSELGGKVGQPRGVLHAGDMTNDGKREQWEAFVRDYGLTGKDGRLAWPVYEAYGNHDGGPKQPVRDGIRDRNPRRVGLTATSDNGLHYSWDWDGIHFINLGIAPGSTTRPYDPEFSMEFLAQDLAKNVRPGQPLVLMHHFGFDKGHSLNWWQAERRDRYFELIRNHNVVAIIHGHAHEPFIYQWNGIDVYHPPHFRQKDPKQGGPVSHGIFVFRIVGDELTVAERKLDGSWGMTARKKIPAASAQSNNCG